MKRAAVVGLAGAVGVTALALQGPSCTISATVAHGKSNKTELVKVTGRDMQEAVDRLQERLGSETPMIFDFKVACAD